MPVAAVAAPRPPKALSVALWSAQVLLALAFGMAGVMKSTQPVDALAPQMAWVTAVPEWLLRFIGVSELAGAIGLLLPALTRIKPFLTPLAATGLVTIMVLASAFHVSRGEASVVPVNAVLGALAVFVAWGRFVKASISPRS